MNQEILNNLKIWRSRKSIEENVKQYMVLQNKTIEEIVEKLPKNKEEFIAVKGLGLKKFEKYGQDILSILWGTETSLKSNNKNILSFYDTNKKDQIFSVSQFLDLVNQNISSFNVSIQGEISSFDYRKHAYFSLKDKNDGSILNCFMWSSDFELCNIPVKEGMEVIIRGYPEIFKPTGRFTIKVRTIELVGKGALKKAYEALKKKLTDEGIFDISLKRKLPFLPVNIGVITSKYGAVINDLLNNLGQYGFKISLYDSRVEGALAIRELNRSIEYFRDKPIDLLVIIRGGGSLESLQPFNNETLIRSIVNYPVPVLCGIGHDKDIPLLSLAADLSLSTPTAAAREINRSWEQSLEKLSVYSSHIIDQYTLQIIKSKSIVKKHISLITLFYQKIIFDFDKLHTQISKSLYFLEVNIKQTKIFLLKDIHQIIHSYESIIEHSKLHLLNSEKELKQNNPKAVMKRGYCILFTDNRVVRSIKQIHEKDKIQIQITDGKIISSVEEIKPK